jgi:putative redox protein
MSGLTARLQYSGSLRTNATHVQSGNSLTTDAPTDNHGLGQNFSPTDLVATALAACMTTIVGILIQNNQLPDLQIECEIRKHMASNPRRIDAIDILMLVSGPKLTEAQQEKLEHAALHCPVALSLHPDLNQNIQFQYVVLQD